MTRLAIAVAAFLLLLAAASSSQSQNDCTPRERLISVVGTAEVNVPPDQVILNLGVESRDKALAAAKADNDSRIKKVIALARDSGVDPKDIMTSSVQMQPQYSDEKTPRLIGYEVSQTIALTVKDLSKYETLMTQLLDAGVNRVDSVNFGLASDRKYRDEARAKAIRAAKEKAVAMATELGQAVGRPWAVSEESPDQDKLANASYGFMGGLSGKAIPEGPSIAPGQLTIRASVNVSFELQ